MFFESQKRETSEAEPFAIQSLRNHAYEVSERTGCSVVVTEGGDNFYGARSLVQMLHDFGNHKSITAISSSAPTTKKALLTRQARYSGLLDMLLFEEGPLVAADTWLAINFDEATLPERLEQAKAAGIRRAFFLMTADGPTDCPSQGMQSALEASGLEFSIMRTGNLIDDGAASSGGGLVLGELDLAVCGDVSKEDVFRFVTEALTLPEASGRSFSLCPSIETQDSLRQMRLCGYERRDEVKAILGGQIVPDAPDAEPSAGEAEAAAELVLRSEAEIAAEREEELKMLLARARERGEATAAKLKYEEEEKLRQREEMSKYYSSPDADAPAGDKPEGGTPDEPTGTSK